MKYSPTHSQVQWKCPFMDVDIEFHVFANNEMNVNNIATSSSDQILLNALNKYNVRFVHWKSNLHLAQSLAGETDLDLYVNPSDREAFSQAVIESGFLKIKSQPWASYHNVEDWLGMDSETTKFLHLHVHYQLITGLKRVKHLVLPWHDYMLDSAICHSSGWPIPSPALEAMILLIRIWAKMPVFERLKSNPKIPDYIIDELRWLLTQASAGDLMDAMERMGLEYECPFFDVDALSAGDASYILSISRNLYRQTSKYYRLNWPLALYHSFAKYMVQLSRRVVNKYIHPAVLRKTASSKGIMVAIIGSDGSGKSTLSRDLNKWLCYKLDSHQVYLGSGDGNTGLVNKLKKIITKSIQVKRTINAKSGIGNKANNKNRIILKKIYRILDLFLMKRKIKHLRYARTMADAGSVMLLDRYPQSQFYGINDGPKLQSGESFSWVGRSELSLYSEVEKYKPDLILKLIVSPHVAHERKPDHSIDDIRKKCDIVDKLFFADVCSISIDANESYENVLKRAKISVWAGLARRLCA